jgi:nicotinamide mononucleotide transporter
MFDVISWLAANWIELFGVLTGIGSVFFLARNKAVLGWGFGIVNALFFIVLFGQALLFADVTLNSYYFFTGIYGFFVWKYGRKTKGYEDKAIHLPKQITHLGLASWLTIAAVVIVGTFLFGTFLTQMTIADFAYVDSFTTMLSFVGQFLLARKVFENWYIWILADVVDIWLYAIKGLFLVSGMTGIFMVLCVMGIIVWRRVERKEAEGAVVSPTIKTDYRLTKAVAS